MSSQLKSQQTDNILCLILSYPEKKNALTPQILKTFIETLANARTSPSPPLVAVITGEGSSFSVGYDLDTLPSYLKEGPLPDELVERAMLAIEEAPFPFIAALNGLAFGGALDLACTCDLRVASRNNQIAITPARLGIVYSQRGLARLASLVGLSLATELFLLGTPIQTERAYELGLIHRLVDTPEEVLPCALSLARKLCKNSPLAVQGMRRALQLVSQKTLNLEEESEIEMLRRDSFSSQDAIEGVRAFFEKRKPTFSGQ